MSQQATGLEIFCRATFSEARISSKADIDEAMSSIDTKMSDSEVGPFIKTLLSPPFSNRPLLELVLSRSDSSARLQSWLLAQIYFPLSPLALEFLKRLSNFLLFSPFTYESGTSKILANYHVWIAQIPIILETMNTDDLSYNSDFVERDNDEDVIGWRVIKRKSTQRKRKQLRRCSTLTGAMEIGMKAFTLLDIPQPTSAMEAEATSKFIVTKMTDILKFFCETLRTPHIAASIAEVIVPPQHVPIDADVGVPTQINLTPSATADDLPSAYPIIQPMKAALYFDSAVGFGEWRVLISTRADRDLRDARRRDAKFFKIVVKKIKELSNGHFSDDNQKRLSGPETEIPIYEAKMTRDSRLIYQVDCIPEYNSEVERQVLKIFGVYTHAQINNRLWNSLARQLGRKGKQYRDRCTYRNRPYHTGDNVISPASFPPLEPEEMHSSSSPNLPQEDLEEIHSLLVLEKFVTFSQALLNSIMADLDVTHVFNVTPQEKEIIEHPTSCYVIGRSGTGKTTTMLFKMLGIERAFQIEGATVTKPRQLFITQSRVLATRVEEYFLKLLDSLSAAGRSSQELYEMAELKKTQQEEYGLIDADDDVNWRVDLPSKFSLLEDHHFPLFLTFDRLLHLLEADIDDFPRCVHDNSSCSCHFFGNGGQLITYSVFLQSYWPHFPQSLTKGLDPSLVFSELLGAIKGSEGTLAQESCYLDKDAYENLSHRAQYSFTAHRATIYAIFNAYMKRKHTRRDFDSADRTHRVLQAFQLHDIPGRKLDYLYVDEVQDNLLIDAFLLRLLCRNPNGLFWAGDTAQTISAGSCFRFDDLKAFLFRLEYRKEVNPEGISIPRYLREPPKSFQLTINYRSHGGIVQCAQTVIELITTFWPYAVDILTQEQGVVDGSKPVFYSGWDQETVRYEQFLFGATGNRIEFGAQQCILVRNEEARDELKRQVGDIGLIMTLYESKGLEFDDVLLYKFFEDSPVDTSQWRVALNLLETPSTVNSPAPRFNETRHAGVCNELKFLYVAVTRARKNLWIVDCSEKGDPMKTLWNSRNLIQSCTPGTDVPRLAVSSSPAEWEHTGRTLFQNKRYLQAMHCFERAGLYHESSVARTYCLREQARMIPENRSRVEQTSRGQAFIKAAESFVACAAEGKNVKETRAYFRAAANCFEQAHDNKRAALAYYDAEEYAIAVKLYRKCGLFDEAVNIVTNHRTQINLEIVNSTIDIARLFYYRENKFEKAGKLFSSANEELEYLEDYDLDVARSGVLERIGRYKEAAELHFAEGRTFEAVQLLLKERGNESIRHASEYILQDLWKSLSFGTLIEPQHNDHVKRMLELASQLQQKRGAFVRTENEQIDMFRAIMVRDLPRLRNLGRIFSTATDPISAILCFEHYFQNFPVMGIMKAEDVAVTLADFLIYTEQINLLRCSEDPCNNVDIQKLFGFRLSSENVFFLPAGTYLHRMIGETRTVFLGSTESGALLSEADLAYLYKNCLLIHLRKKVLDENEKCRGAGAFNLCLTFAVLGYCNRTKCPRQHLEAKSLTPFLYNIRIRIHMQQILILQSLLHAGCLGAYKRRKHQRDWVDRLHQALYPSHYCLGTISNLNISNIPEAQRAIWAIRGWIQQIVYTEYRPDPKLVTTVYHAANVGMLLDKLHAPEYIEKAPILSQFLHRDIFLRSEKQHAKEALQRPCIMHELVECLQAKHEAFISMGILFVRHVIQNEISININVLCDVLDYICGSIILIKSKFKLHNKTLPRSWFIYLLSHLKRRDAEITLAGVFMDTIGMLLKNLTSGRGIEYLLFENTDISKVHNTRNIFISRICRTLGLLGYNFSNNGQLGCNILIHFRPLRPLSDTCAPAIYRSYAEAKTWGQIAQAVQKSTMNSTLDDLVQLQLESTSSQSISTLPGIQRVRYKAVEDIPRLLGGSSIHALLSDLRIDAPVFTPRNRTNSIRGEQQKVSEPLVRDGSDEAEESEVDSTVVFSATAVADSIANNVILQTSVAPTKGQLNAAMVILTAYRKATGRKAAMKATLDAQFMACLAESKSMSEPICRYRLIFLGPLPHALRCLLAVNMHCIAAKAKAKKRLSEVTHQELDNAGKKLTEIKGLSKECHKLQKILCPSSSLHRRRDIRELKRCMLEVEALVHRIPPSPGLLSDLAIALKGIVTERQPTKSLPKPGLCLEDEELDYVMQL